MRSQNVITFVIARAMSDRIARSRERDVIYWTLQGPREMRQQRLIKTTSLTHTKLRHLRGHFEEREKVLYFPTQRSTLLNDPFAHSSTTTTFSAFKLHKYVIYSIVDIYVNFHAAQRSGC